MERIRWSEIPDWPDYAISEEGEVVNIRHGRSITPYLQKNNMYKVGLYKNGERKDALVHHLVASAFLRGYSAGRHVDFLDGDTTNVHVSNLQMRRPGIEEGLYIPKHVRGRRVAIVETGETFTNAYSCAEYLNTRASNIYSCLQGRRKSHLGFTFKYVSSEVEPWAYRPPSHEEQGL